MLLVNFLYMSSSSLVSLGAAVMVSNNFISIVYFVVQEADYVVFSVSFL